MRLRVAAGAADEYRVPLCLLAIASIGAAIMSCAPSGSWEGTLDERGGVTYVANSSTGTWAHPDRAPFALVLERVFGVEDSPEADAGIYTASERPLAQVRRYRVEVEQ